MCGPEDPFEGIVLEQQPVKKHSNQAPIAGFKASALAFVPWSFYSGCGCVSNDSDIANSASINSMRERGVPG